MRAKASDVAATQKRQGLLFVLVIAPFLILACAEKSVEPTQQASSEKETENGGTDNTPLDNEEFDLCLALKNHSKLSKSKGFVDELCSGTLTALRKSDAVYTGGTPKLKLTENVSGDKSSFRVLSSLLVPVKPQEYYDMVRLQYLKSNSFKDNFEVGDHIDLSIENSTQTSAAFEYTNSSVEESIVRYRAKTDFIVLKEGVAYAFLTDLVETKETLEGLKGLIVINKKSSDETEVFSISDQDYNNSGDPLTCKSNVSNQLGNEQKRSYNNGKNAAKAPSLLKE